MKKSMVMSHRKSTKRTEVYEAPNSYIEVLYINRAAFQATEGKFQIPLKITITIEANLE